MQVTTGTLHHRTDRDKHPLPLQVLKYLRQIAVITPYSQFRFKYTAQDERNSVAVTFARRTLKMPVPPVVRTLLAKLRLCTR